MATSSITHNFVLDAETAVRFFEALEESEKNYVPLGDPNNTHEIKDPEEIKALARRLEKKYGTKAK